MEKQEYKEYCMTFESFCAANNIDLGLNEDIDAVNEAAILDLIKSWTSAVKNTWESIAKEANMKFEDFMLQIGSDKFKNWAKRQGAMVITKPGLEKVIAKNFDLRDDSIRTELVELGKAYGKSLSNPSGRTGSSAVSI
jgi:hypothetical protein